MNTSSKAFLATLAAIGCFLVFLLIAGVYVGSTYNTEATLLNTYSMKVKDNQSEFDNMFKKIKQVAQVPDAKKDAFKEVFTAYATARTNQSQNQLMTWVKESAPQFNLDIYDKVMNIVVGSRDSWTMRQKELVDIAREYNQNLQVFPSNIVLKIFGFKVIDPQIITSTHTQEVFQSGKDDDLQLLPKK